MIQTIKKYLQDVKLEAEKVSWPSQQTTINLTVLVVLVSGLLALYLGGLDYLFSQLFAWIFVWSKR